MAEYITKDVAKVIVTKATTKHDTLMMIEALPTVDAVPVIHGRWIPYNSKYGHDEKVYLCDQCNNNVGFKKMNFCPNCGADMRKDGGNGDE